MKAPADKLRELRKALDGVRIGEPAFIAGIIRRADRDAVVALMNAAPALLAIAEAAVEFMTHFERADADLCRQAKNVRDRMAVVHALDRLGGE